MGLRHSHCRQPQDDGSVNPLYTLKRVRELPACPTSPNFLVRSCLWPTKPNRNEGEACRDAEATSMRR